VKWRRDQNGPPERRSEPDWQQEGADLSLGRDLLSRSRSSKIVIVLEPRLFSVGEAMKGGANLGSGVLGPLFRTLQKKCPDRICR
jgi:hypothetical protein